MILRSAVSAKLSTVKHVFPSGLRTILSAINVNRFMSRLWLADLHLTLSTTQCSSVDNALRRLNTNLKTNTDASLLAVSCKAVPSKTFKENKYFRIILWPLANSVPSSALSVKWLSLRVSFNLPYSVVNLYTTVLTDSNRKSKDWKLKLSNWKVNLTKLRKKLNFLKQLPYKFKWLAQRVYLLKTSSLQRTVSNVPRVIH
jgi:hypothetical protein